MPRVAKKEDTAPQAVSQAAHEPNGDALKTEAIRAGLKLCESVINSHERDPYKALEVLTGLINAVK